MIRFDEQFILFYLRSKMLQAERSMEGLWFWNIFWICQMLLSWSCGIRNGPPSSGKWRCFLGSPTKNVVSVGRGWAHRKICGIQWYLMLQAWNSQLKYDWIGIHIMYISICIYIYSTCMFQSGHSRSSYDMYLISCFHLDVVSLI